MSLIYIVGAAIAAFLYFASQASSDSSDNAPAGVPVAQPNPTDEPIPSFLIDKQALVSAMANGIANGEGYLPLQRGAGSKPQRYNNPGSLKNLAGQYIAFATSQDGWKALFQKLANILDGGSTVYPLTMTIDQLAQKWTDDAPGSVELQSWESCLLTACNAAGFPCTEQTFLNDLASGQTTNPDSQTAADTSVVDQSFSELD